MRNLSSSPRTIVLLALIATSCAHLDSSASRRADETAAVTHASADSEADSKRIERMPAGDVGRSRETSSQTSEAIRPISYDENHADRKRLPALAGPVEPADRDILGPFPHEAGSHSVEPFAEAFTIDDLEQIALENNPTIQQAAAVVDQAWGIRTQVGLYPNPTVGYLGEEIGNEGTAGQQGGFIAQTIVTGGKLSLSESVADREIQNLAWELEAQRYRVRNAARSQFYETLGAQHRVEIARELLDVARQGVEVAEELFQAQQVARPDVLQARILFNEMRILLKNAELDYEAAWKQLATVVGEPDWGPAGLVGTLDQDGTDRDPETLLAELLDASPEIQAARSRIARAHAQIRRQEAQPIPNLLAQVGVSHDYSSGDDLAMVQLGLPLPIFNRNQGNRQLASAEYRRAVGDLRRVELSLRNRFATAFRDYRQAKYQVERYREDILPTAEENLRLTEEGYRQGEFDLLRALTAQQSFFETNLAYINSLVALRQAEVTLSGLLLTGGLNEIPDTIGGNLQGIGLRDQALNGQ